MQQKQWFSDKCPQFLDQRKQATMQSLQDPYQSNIDNLNNIQHKGSGHFRNKTDYLKAKVSEPETNSRHRNIRDLYHGIRDFENGYRLELI